MALRNNEPENRVISKRSFNWSGLRMCHKYRIRLADSMPLFYAPQTFIFVHFPLDSNEHHMPLHPLWPCTFNKSNRSSKSKQFRSNKCRLNDGVFQMNVRLNTNRISLSKSSRFSVIYWAKKIVAFPINFTNFKRQSDAFGRQHTSFGSNPAKRSLHKNQNYKRAIVSQLEMLWVIHVSNESWRFLWAFIACQPHYLRRWFVDTK